MGDLEGRQKEKTEKDEDEDRQYVTPHPKLIEISSNQLILVLIN